jgi:undecaprenyl-diphosphatase
LIVPLPLLAVILGIVEGITEFLPISSTGHLILVAHGLGFTGDRAEVFEIFIQLGAVLAVVVEYRTRLFGVARGLGRSAASRRFAANVGIAFLPAAVVGLIVHRWITEHLFGPVTVAAALIVGAVAILVVETRRREPSIQEVDGITPSVAAWIGLAQCVSMWPGFSRSAATILGGLVCGVERKAATEFSFYLAIPTLGAATVYDLVKKRALLAPGDLTWLFVSTLISFVVAWAAIRWLLRFVATHDLKPFAWYRIALGIVVLAVLR